MAKFLLLLLLLPGLAIAEPYEFFITFNWQHSGELIDGRPVDLDRFELAQRNAAGALTIIASDIPGDARQYRRLFSAEPGETLAFTLRAIAIDRDPSAWIADVLFTVPEPPTPPPDTTAPAPPTNFTISFDGAKESSLIAPDEALAPIFTATLNYGARPYEDRGYTILQYPSELQGATLLTTYNGAKDVHPSIVMVAFEALIPVDVYVGMDERMAAYLGDHGWLSQFQPTGWVVEVDMAGRFDLHVRRYNAGERVEIGGNGGVAALNGHYSNYILILDYANL